MAEYLTEQEQVELLKGWIKKYSVTIFIGIALAVVAIFGWRSFQEHHNKLNTHASLIFDEMLTARTQRDTDTISLTTDKLFAHYPRTIYGSFAALMLARDATNQNNYPEAEKQLNWVIHHSHIASLKQIARLRLARIFITKNEPDKALILLNQIEDPHFDGLIDEVKGDAYLSMNQISMARKWYQNALKALPDAEAMRPILQMKYDNLAAKADD